MKLLRWHLGMGDALLCNGLVRALVERGERLLLPCWHHNLNSVQDLFFDLIEDGRVSLVVTDSDSYEIPHWCQGEIRLGYYGQSFNRLYFDRSFYDQAGVDFAEKRNRFRIGRVMPDPGGDMPEVFIHDDDFRGFSIPLRGYRPEKSKSLFSHFHQLVNARQIHCINSCFAILADLLPAPGHRILHRYARPDAGELPDLGPGWVILNKP